MKKNLRKLTLTRETLLSMDDWRRVTGGIKTVDATYCISNCPPCYHTQLSNCC
ncbi:MAG TPA: hypothetical protein VMW27_13560 [Thermoanaerobaculia bacterium]|nr:hypothetical protein [Thermoanaerobaculia bacterium]